MHRRSFVGLIGAAGAAAQAGGMAGMQRAHALLSARTRSELSSGFEPVAIVVVATSEPQFEGDEFAGGLAFLDTGAWVY